MPNFSQTASAASVLPVSGGDTHISEGFTNALARGLDRVWKRKFDRPKEGMQFLREESTRFETQTFRTFRPIGGSVGMNRDTEDIPFAQRGEGFGFSLQTYNYRRGIKIEKTLQEVDDVGVVRGLQGDLADNANLTVELAIADLFNRGCNPSNAPVLCDDGMYLLDKSRPNADPTAGSWSNEFTATAITPGSIFSHQVLAAAYTDEVGELSPRMIKRLIIRPTDEKTVWEILRSDLRPTDAMNAGNFEFGRFEYTVYNFLTDACLYYIMGDLKGEENEAMFFWRVPPEFATWVGDNPDVVKQRVRMAFGIALGSPRKVWAGHEVS